MTRTVLNEYVLTDDIYKQPRREAAASGQNLSPRDAFHRFNGLANAAIQKVPPLLNKRYAPITFDDAVKSLGPGKVIWPPGSGMGGLNAHYDMAPQIYGALQTIEAEMKKMKEESSQGKEKSDGGRRKTRIRKTRRSRKTRRNRK